MSPHRQLMMAALATAALAAGCASSPPRPTEEMARAQTLIEQAEQQGGQQYAAVEISQAREKLKGADDAAEKGNTKVAQRLATEATVDARLALVRTSSGKAKAAAGEVSNSVETLRREATRNSAGTP